MQFTLLALAFVASASAMTEMSMTSTSAPSLVPTMTPSVGKKTNATVMNGNNTINGIYVNGTFVNGTYVNGTYTFGNVTVVNGTVVGTNGTNSQNSALVSGASLFAVALAASLAL